MYLLYSSLSLGLFEFFVKKSDLTLLPWNGVSFVLQFSGSAINASKGLLLDTDRKWVSLELDCMCDNCVTTAAIVGRCFGATLQQR